ncbi:hypothetical protein SAMN06265340_1229 [Desulfurobacterium atlanticum]|uniref:Uncharacterized protein n=1 Tax=Desulfurobacterium atlanticum TaxID=240169 RepID=A0A239AFR1_9BACT|nr:hypothetical protein SAMN06265340_1229 [Desulfurobacterium atlanticum]
MNTTTIDPIVALILMSLAVVIFAGGILIINHEIDKKEK